MIRNLNIKTIIAQFMLTVVYFACLIPFIPFKVDDAYISFVYSKNLLAGNGLTYNGIVVEGFSNPFWTILLTPFIGLGLDALFAARLISIISGLFTILMIFQLTQDLISDDSLIYPFLATSSITVLASFIAWTLGGLETVFLSALIVFFVFIEWRNPPYRNLLSPILLVMIALTRPEGLLVFVVWFIYRGIFVDIQIKDLILESLVFVIPFSLFIFIRWLSFGFLLPNTAYIKVEPGLSVSLDALSWLVSFFTLRPLFGIMLIFGVFSIFRRSPINKKIILSFGISLGFIAFIIFSGRDWMPHHRFITPIIPLMAIPIASMLDGFKKPIHRRIMVVLVIISISFEIFMTYTIYKPLSIEFGQFTEGLIQAGKWINTNIDEGDTIAVVDAGALAYYSDRKTIDILGLNDVHIAHSKNKLDAEYILEFAPSVIQLHVGYSDTGDLFAATDTDHNQSIINHPKFLECYKPQLDRPTDPFYPYLFLRICE